MTRFHAQWSDQLCRVILPYLQDTDELTERLMEIAGLLREWAISRGGVRENLARCNRTYTRFTTPGMTKLLPDIPGAPSGWGTENHYFYEILNRTGKAVYIQFSISSKNSTPEFRQLCDQINEFYPAKLGKEEWQWRAPFRTSTISLEGALSKETLFARLDECMKEILAFEDDLNQKLHLN